MECLLSQFLPAGVLDIFNVDKFETTSTRIDIYLLEKEIMPEGHAESDVKLHGTLPGVVVRDFPIRDKDTYLHIVRRRWYIKSTGKTISRDLRFIANNTKISSEFANFLKYLHQ